MKKIYSLLFMLVAAFTWSTSFAVEATINADTPDNVRGVKENVSAGETAFSQGMTLNIQPGTPAYFYSASGANITSIEVEAVSGSNVTISVGENVGYNQGSGVWTVTLPETGASESSITYNSLTLKINTSASKTLVVDQPGRYKSITGSVTGSFSYASGTASLEPTESMLTIVMNDGYKLTKAVRNDNNNTECPISESYGYYYVTLSAAQPGETITLTSEESGPAQMIFNGPDGLNISFMDSSFGTSYASFDGSKYVVENYSPYGSVEISVKEEYKDNLQIDKVTDSSYNQFTPDSSGIVYVSCDGYPAGDTFTIETSEPVTEQKTTFTFQFMDKASPVNINTEVDYQYISDTDLHEIEFTTIPSSTTWVTIQFQFISQKPYRVTLDDTELDSSYYVGNDVFFYSDYGLFPHDGSVIQVWMEDPNPAMTSVSFTTKENNQSLKGFYKSIMVNNLRYDEPYVDGIDFVQGTNLEVYFNTTDFDVHSISVKKDGVEEVLWNDTDEEYSEVEIPGSWYSSLTWDTLEFVADVELSRYKRVTFKTENPESVIITDKTYLIDYTLTDPEQTIEFLTSTENIAITGAEGYKVTEIKIDGNSQDDVREPIEITNGMSIEVTTAEYVRNNTVTVFLNDDDVWDSVELYLGKGQGWEKSYKLQPGYTVINYNDDDLPIAVLPRPNSGGIKGSIYRNDTSNVSNQVTDDEFIGYYVQNIADGDYIYIYENAAQAHTVTYDIAENLDVTITHHKVQEVANTDEQHTLMHNAEISIRFNDPMTLSASYYRNSVKVNGVEIEANEDGEYVHRLTEDADIAISKVGEYEVSFSFENADTNGFVTAVELDGEAVENWEEGFDAESGQEIKLTFNCNDYKVTSAELNGVDFASNIEVDDGVGTYTATVDDDPLAFSFNVRLLATNIDVEFDFENDNTSEFLVGVTAEGEEVDVENDHFYATEDQVLEFTFNTKDYVIESLELNGNDIVSDLVENEEEGTAVYTVTVGTDALVFSIEVNKLSDVEVSFSFENEGTASFLKGVTLDGENVDNFAAGFEAVEGQALVLTLDTEGYDIESIMLNDTDVTNQIVENEETGEATLTVTVPAEDVAFSFNVTAVSDDDENENGGNTGGDNNEEEPGEDDPSEDDPTSGIIGIDAEILQNAVIYNLNGFRINNVENLQPGIYIINGRKVVVRK